MDPLLSLLMAAIFGVHLVLGAVLLPLVQQARAALADAFLRVLIPRVLLLGLCLAGLATACLLLRDLRPGLLLSCMLFVALGNGLAHHILRVRGVLDRAQREPQAVLRPLQLLNSAQLAVATVGVVVHSGGL